MDTVTKIFQKLSLRFRITLTFTLIIIVALAALSSLSYVTIREIYLNQMSEQVHLLLQNLVANLNVKYIELLPTGSDSAMVKEYYTTQLSERLTAAQFEEGFIFQMDAKIVLHIGHSAQNPDPLPALILNRPELTALPTGHTFTSSPFKGRDGRWYLWGFHRISELFFLGVRENASRLARVDQLSLLFWVIGLGAVLLSLSAGWIVAGMISRPVDRLVNFSREMGKGNFTAPLPGNIHGELGILRDALDRMRGDLQHLHREKEQMLAQIAHELRNPLGAIELMAGLAREDLPKGKRKVSYIDKIISEITQLKTLVHEFLEYSRAIQARPEPVVLRTMVDEVSLLLKQPLQQKNITLTLGGDHHRLWFDPTHLRQILMNLIANSIETSPPGSIIAIVLQETGRSHTLSVSDQGAGIAADIHAKIFEPFYSTKQSGIGLGLAICKKLCQANRAEIFARNNPERGCTFYIVKSLEREG